jgi:hypothetical protein
MMIDSKTGVPSTSSSGTRPSGDTFWNQAGLAARSMKVTSCASPFSTSAMRLRSALGQSSKETSWRRGSMGDP